VEDGLKLIGSIVRQCPLLLDAHEIRQITCRFFLLGMTLLLALMPLMEYFTTWDRFFPGGHDVEFGLLGVAVFFSLAVILSQGQEMSIFLLLSAQRLIPWLSRRVRIRAARKMLSGDIAISLLGHAPGWRLETCNRPLRI
jgi:hypothetical protein